MVRHSCSSRWRSWASQRTPACRLKAVRQNSTFEERVELVFDELRQAGTGGFLGLSEEALGVLLHQAVQRSLLRSVALVVDRGAIAVRPAGLAGVGLHVMGAGSLG